MQLCGNKKGGHIIVSNEIEARVYLAATGNLIPARVQWNNQGRISRISRLDTRTTSLPILLPGFIDEHIHGADGHDVMEATADSWRHIEQALARHGVTGFLATTITAPWPELMAVADLARTYEVGRDSICLGMHWEGPYLDPGYKGAQPEEFIRPIVLTEIEHIIARSQNARLPLQIMTVAPNQPGALEAVRLLVASGVRVNMGHSGATRDEALAGISAGADGVTHLFNAMAPLHHREPGLIGVGLTSEKAWVELITDGVHIHPDIVRMVFALAAPRVILVTDGISAIDCQPGRHRLGQWMVNVDGASARLDDGTLAGSILTPDQSLRNLLDWGISLRAIVGGWSEAPARRLQLEGRGRIEEGAWADMVELDAQYQVRGTIKNGQWIYRR